MERETFKVEINFLTKVFSEEAGAHIDERISKHITFKELDATDSSQHLLHFLIASMLEFKEGNGGSDDKVMIGYEKMYDLAVKAVGCLMIIGEGVTEADKTCILNDSFALINFADWFASKKALPFFLLSRRNLVK